MLGLFFMIRKPEQIDPERFLEIDLDDACDREICDRIRNDVYDYEMLDMDYDYEE